MYTNVENFWCLTKNVKLNKLVGLRAKQFPNSEIKKYKKIENDRLVIIFSKEIDTAQAVLTFQQLNMCFPSNFFQNFILEEQI